jgi:hypothetical protein
MNTTLGLLSYLLILFYNSAVFIKVGCTGTGRGSKCDPFGKRHLVFESLKLVRSSRRRLRVQPSGNSSDQGKGFIVTEEEMT